MSISSPKTSTLRNHLSECAGILALVVLTSFAACGGYETTADAATVADAGSDLSDAATADAESSTSPCPSWCAPMVAANCANGPQTQEECETNCEETLAGDCGDEFLAVQECGGETPVADCRMDQPHVPGCENESMQLNQCKANLP